MLKIGLGYDSHTLVAGRKLILGGVEIPSDRGLAGHSDADALLHAVSDAILGAVGAGDIGVHFPDTDPAYSGISSMVLLERVKKIMENKGYCLNNIDATVILEKPKLVDYFAPMVANISRLLAVDASSVNVKAKTNEGMGFAGRGEGIAVIAVVTVIKKTGR
ncbi:MAG: 2-C-methyl-D-erythritol 2,4-cyclodiphosphate synthase [Syntrophales bacterium]